MQLAALIVIAYFLGSIPFGFIAGKVFRGIDIRDYGSGNIGATNVFRTLGKGLGTAVFLFDTMKGAAAVMLAQMIVPGDHQAGWVIAAGLTAIVGHTASPFLRFKGGKGVATSLGVIVGMNPLIALVTFVIWVSLVAITRYVSIASLVASYSVPTMMFLSEPLFHQKVPTSYAIFALVASTFILIKHRSNIKRLLNGTEARFGQRVKLEGDSDSNG